MMDQIVSRFSDAHFLAVLFAAIGSAATVLTAAMPWLQPDTLSRRIKAVSTEKAKIQLAMAGFRGVGAEYAFLALRLAAPIAFFLATLVYEFAIIKWNQPLMVKIGVAIAASYLGIKAPELS